MTRPLPEGERRVSSRIRLAALLGSLLLHIGFAFVLLHVGTTSRPKRTVSASTEIEVREIEVPRVSPALSPSPSKPKIPSKTHRTGGTGQRLAEPSARPTPSQGAAGAAAPTMRGEPLADDVPRRLDLSIHGTFETASPGGVTVHNRPGEVEPEGVQKSLAQSRINQWIDEDTASRRVDKGLVDDWFARLDRSLDQALNSAPPPAGFRVTGSPFGSYAAAAAQYGATGTPGGASTARSPPSLPPAAEGPLGPALGAPGMFRLQIDSSSSDPWAVVELSFDLGGKLRGSRVLESSGNREFNLHVVKVVALGLPGLPDLPDAGEGIHPDGTRSVWRIHGHLTFQHGHSANDIWYLPLAAAANIATGINLDDFAGGAAGKPHLDCKVELLQVY